MTREFEELLKGGRVVFTSSSLYKKALKVRNKAPYIQFLILKTRLFMENVIAGYANRLI